MLETLCEQTESSAVPGDELQIRAALIEEDVQAAREHVLLPIALHECDKAIDRLPQIDSAPVRHDASRFGSEEHGSAPQHRSRARRPSGSSISKVQAPVASAGGATDVISTKPLEVFAAVFLGDFFGVGFDSFDRSFLRQRSNVLLESPSDRQNAAKLRPLASNRFSIASRSAALRTTRPFDVATFVSMISSDP
jgi:hypothetical protein